MFEFYLYVEHLPNASAPVTFVKTIAFLKENINCNKKIFSNILFHFQTQVFYD